MRRQDFVVSDSKDLPMLGNVTHETLRLYPPVGFCVREAAQSQCIRDKDAGKGSPILISPWLLHRHRLLRDTVPRLDAHLVDSTDLRRIRSFADTMQR
ncbi:cytochrome P450 [Cupriavidus metallidurans]|nr:cytochrome P450 [Cupriavidus metallidurans]